MVKRGWVIKAGGDAEIAGAIQSGMLAVRRTDTSEAVYGRNPRNIVYRAFWGVVGLVCYGVNAAYCRLSAMNRAA